LVIPVRTCPALAGDIFYALKHHLYPNPGFFLKKVILLILLPQYAGRICTGVNMRSFVEGCQAANYYSTVEFL
jgi:hypothetical protein